MIYEKILILLERKIRFYKDPVNLYARSLKTRDNSENIDVNVVYPPQPSQLNNKNSQSMQNPDFGKSSLSVRDFLVLGMEALILSCNDHDKIPLSLELLHKNFQFLKKMIFNT